ncbi:YIP1 family protein [Elioraea rosea]|uniref:YIP1 family protein n=1 Tax=Elioraea rosea TaxID=2492390 RepID=UPI00118312A4|nr:hypothetical protein [Elioraea rosea]
MTNPAPSPRLRRIAAGVWGGFMLARGREDGMAVVDTSPEGAWASFAAMWICAPAFLALHLLVGQEGGLGLRAFAAQAVGYVIDWFAFPLLMWGVMEQMGRRRNFPAFVAAWNWSTVPQVLAAMAAAAIGALPGVPAAVGVLLGLAALAYAVWVAWFVAKTALDVPGARAGFVVGAGVMLGLFIDGLALTIGAG